MTHTQKAKEAIRDWWNSTGAVTLNGTIFVRQYGEGGTVLFELQPWAEGIGLGLIQTMGDCRGKGVASRALDELIAVADRHGVPITGSIKPMGPGPRLTKAQLKQWYRRRGFEIKRDEIKRPPRPQQRK